MSRMLATACIAISALALTACSADNTDEPAARGLAADEFTNVGEGIVVLSGQSGDLTFTFQDGSWILRADEGAAVSVPAMFRIGEGESINFESYYGSLYFKVLRSELQMLRGYPVSPPLDVKMTANADGSFTCSTITEDDVPCSLDPRDFPKGTSLGFDFRE